jgi:flagellar biosynthesis/type III secretory pathway protein FliH
MDRLFGAQAVTHDRARPLSGAGRAMPDHGKLFAEDFDLPRHGRAKPVPEVINPTYTSAELAEARAEAWAGGVAAGIAEANATIAASTRSLLDAIAASLTEAKAAAAAVAEHAVEAIARLLLDSLAKLFPTLCERHGEAEVSALIRTILPALAQEPMITVRMNPTHTPALMRELDRLDPDLVERVRLVPVEAIAIGDVRVNWRDGAAVRDTAGLWQQVRAVLQPAGLLSPETAPAPEAVPTQDRTPTQDRAPTQDWAPTQDRVPATSKETEHAD